jgi:3',5'-cyclic AMP phosphodiesterase CpdA
VTFRLAHVTDPHFRGAGGLSLGDVFTKRMVGFVNVVVNRRRKHRMELLASLADDLRAQPVDHVAVTGDLSNVSLPGEWAAARRWLEGLGRATSTITAIPGNHDVYVPAAVGGFEEAFAPFQGSDAGLEAGPATHPYPFVRVRDRIALIALNSCVPTGDLGAWGELGEAQLARLRACLAAPALAQRTRVVLLHHPPVRLKGGEDRNLKDRAALAAVLSETGAELVLHGHDHRDEEATLEGPGGRSIPVVGAGSASYAGHAQGRARYNIYELSDGAIEVATRAHDPGVGAFREVRRAKLV